MQYMLWVFTHRINTSIHPQAIPSEKIAKQLEQEGWLEAKKHWYTSVYM